LPRSGRFFSESVQLSGRVTEQRLDPGNTQEESNFANIKEHLQEEKAGIEEEKAELR
jgi:hypothetical protein